jgi:hypothetical protein
MPQCAYTRVYIYAMLYGSCLLFMLSLISYFVCVVITLQYGKVTILRLRMCVDNLLFILVFSALRRYCLH